MKVIKIIGISVVAVFAIIGFIFSAVFVAMQFDLLNVRGSIEDRNNSIFSTGDSASSLGDETNNGSKFSAVDYSCKDELDICAWIDTNEWDVVAGGLTKDIEIINRVAAETDVSPRLIASVVIPEQIRFFTSEREVFKRYFEPLKILGSMSKFSLGVSGIKQETAENVEKHSLDENSPFYPGEKYSKLISYESQENKNEQLFNRLTDEKNHYYSYLYTAIFIKEILMQWENAGYDISENSEIVATIFNIGFNASNPNPNPQVGGATIKVGGNAYSFGKLAGLFYNSDQLPQLAK